MLRRISSRKIANILSRVPFGRDIKVNSLDKLLDVFDSENVLPYFPGIGNNIASDMINAVICYLHQNDIFHRDIKPSNVLVNNHYYSSLKASRLNAVFQEQHVVCKLMDLGEVRSSSCRNFHDHKEYTYTLYY